MPRIISLEEYLERHGYRVAEFQDLDPATNTPVVQERWVKVKPFNPKSPQQVLAYMRHMGHPVPLTLRENKPTTGEKELDHLYNETGDEVYKLTIEHRSLSKLLANDLPNWKPDQDGRVHTHFGYHPANWQLSSRRPNVQNAAKHDEIGRMFRSMIVARPGHLLVEFDVQGFHAIMLGREAQSEKYIELARRDIHSFVGSYIQPPSVPYELLKKDEAAFVALLKEFRAKHSDIRELQAKPSVHGIGFGLGFRKLFRMNRKSFKDEKRAKWVIDLLKELFPEVFAWQHRVRLEAHYNTYLRNAFGGIRWFFDVFSFKRSQGKWLARPGAESEEAVAYLPASDAHGMLRLMLLVLAKRGICEKYNFINTVHDSIILEPRKQELEGCIDNVSRVMTATCPKLADPVVCPRGLSVGVDVTVGQCWAKGVEGGMKPWDLEAMRPAA